MHLTMSFSELRNRFQASVEPIPARLCKLWCSDEDEPEDVVVTNITALVVDKMYRVKVVHPHIGELAMIAVMSPEDGMSVMYMEDDDCMSPYAVW